MALFKQVAIVGTGLIGGSLGLAIKEKKLAEKVLGFSRHQQSIEQALSSQAIDQGSTKLEIIRDADLVILALPIDTILNLAGAIAKLVKPGAIVSDVASTKEKIVSRLEKAFPLFVGAHPLAGSEKRGILNARADIFKGCLCLISVSRRTDIRARHKIAKLWVKLGAKVACLSPAAHDKILASVSHLPHAVAFSLMNSVAIPELKFAASGLKDTTRIAASDEQIWAEIFLSNRLNCLKAIGRFQQQLAQLKNALQKADKKKILFFLKQARIKRNKLY